MGKKLDVGYFETVLQEAQEKCYKKAPEIKSSHRKAFVESCEVFHDLYEQLKAASSEEELTKAAKEQQKAMKKCVKAANKVLEKIDLLENNAVVDAALKGVIIMKNTVGTSSLLVL